VYINLAHIIIYEQHSDYSMMYSTVVPGDRYVTNMEPAKVKSGWTISDVWVQRLTSVTVFTTVSHNTTVNTKLISQSRVTTKQVVCSTRMLYTASTAVAATTSATQAQRYPAQNARCNRDKIRL